MAGPVGAAGKTGAVLKRMPTPKIDAILHALGDPTRRAMVERLSHGPMSVSRLAEPLNITLTAVGQHLNVLKRGSLVKTQKSGRVRSCSLDPAGFSLLQFWVSEQSSALEKKLDRLGEILSEEDG
jgi:DNA-binding transcriptional ArsR family regulator